MRRGSVYKLWPFNGVYKKKDSSCTLFTKWVGHGPKIQLQYSSTGLRRILVCDFQCLLIGIFITKDGLAIFLLTIFQKAKVYYMIFSNLLDFNVVEVR